MKLPPSSGTYNVSILWSFAVRERFNVLRIGTIFKQTGNSLIIGGEDGIIRIYDLPVLEFPVKPQAILESKGGPIQTMCIYDVTRFYNNDLLVADSKGLLTIFCNKQILNRQPLTTDCINSLQVLQNSSGSSEIITATDSGVITASSPTEELWRINFNDAHKNVDSSQLLTVTCMLVTELTDQSGIVQTYLLVADSSCFIHVIYQGTVVMSLKSPTVISAMVAGRFVSYSSLGLVQPNIDTTPKPTQQVALGSKTGAIYILHNFSITIDEFANCKCPITQLSLYKQRERETDLLLCCGHINSLIIFHDGKVICNYETNDWISTIDTGDIDDDNETEIIIGCLDNTVTALKLNIS